MTFVDVPDGEPIFAPWRPAPTAGIAIRIAELAGRPLGRPRVIAIDGRSASGKSTFAAELAAELPGVAIVHTDDVAWHHSFFEWSKVLIDGVLDPVWSGRTVRFRPPVWDERGRDGAIEVPAETRTLIVEGVGAAREDLMPYIDVVIWIQSDASIARARGIARDGGDAAASAFWDQWMSAEIPFLARERPWDRADLVVTGTPPASPRQPGASAHQPNSVWISRSSELAQSPFRHRKSKLIF